MNRKKNLFFLIIIYLYPIIKNKTINEEKITQNSNEKSGIKYDIDKITDIFQNLNIPQNYNFIEETNAKVHIRDQGNCGSSWSIASTTALSYRYHKIGIDIDLSPQYPLSCYIRDCKNDNYGIDPQLNLVKNGTVSEECFPYSSENEIIEECPLSCKDGSELKKYYAKNAYKTPEIDNNNYYENVEIIIDQIYNYGPVVANIKVYDEIISINQSECKNKDYIFSLSNDKGSFKYSSVVIVGFGYLNSKYYWLIQNSKGPKYCDNGFMKIEFGEIGIENVAFSQPYIRTEPKDGQIVLETSSFSSRCELEIKEIDNKNNLIIDDSFEFFYENIITTDIFYFQCGVIILPKTKEKEINCYYEQNKLKYINYGPYAYQNYNVLTGNNLNIDIFFNEFDYYGAIEIKPVSSYAKQLYFSSEGKKFLLKLIPQNEERISLPSIFPSKSDHLALKDCNYFKFLDTYYISCSIKESEIIAFKYSSQNAYKDSLFYYGFCELLTTNVNVFRLDIKLYPIFIVEKFLLPNENSISEYSKFYFEGSIKGGLSGYNKANYNSFLTFVNIEMDSTNNNISIILNCEIYSIDELKKKFKAKCYIEQNKIILNKKKFKSINILPYFSPYIARDPFEVIISDKIEILNEYKKFGIKYDVDKINDIFKKLNIPQNYNFIEETQAKVHIRDQGDCGSCWTIASATALSYRYHKIGIDVDLSPQFPLSCYKKDCDGNLGIDPQLNLVKNGTVTEGCLPYSSDNGIIEDCPSSCKDGSEFKKYYAKNAFEVPKTDNNNYYENVEIIIDQIYNYGPVKSSINLYSDFISTPNCKDKNYIYSYDGKSISINSYHAVVIVGFGYLDSEYYWLIQNSYGKDFCDNGFMKIEFGEVGIENVAIIDPYIPSDSENKNNISIEFSSIKDECDIDISIPTNSLNNLKDSFEIIYKNEFEPFNYFYYQCGTFFSPISKEKTINCYYEKNRINFLENGYYKFHSLNGVRNDKDYFVYNNFENIRFKFNNNLENITTFFSMSKTYISNSESKIILQYNTFNKKLNKDFLPYIYPNKNENPLKDCDYLQFKNNKYIVCNIKDFEVNYFQQDYIDFYTSNLYYSNLCGVKKPAFLYVYQLDRTKYPVFYAQKLILPNEEEFSFSSKFILEGKIEGNLSEYNSVNHFFSLFINIEMETKVNNSYILDCNAYPIEEITTFRFECKLQITLPIKKKNCNKFYVLPYFIPNSDMILDKFEVIIPEEMEILNEFKKS